MTNAKQIRSRALPFTAGALNLSEIDADLIADRRYLREPRERARAAGPTIDLRPGQPLFLLEREERDTRGHTHTRVRIPKGAGRRSELPGSLHRLLRVDEIEEKADRSDEPGGIDSREIDAFAAVNRTPWRPRFLLVPRPCGPGRSLGS
ncbi:hypothetical protein KM043_004572 [Ampulex compressa]|nr:hypothetical protein KM043_004572 [Ampulex compressa]